MNPNLGFHFTVRSHWELIRETGLEPRIVKNKTPFPVAGPCICCFDDELPWESMMVAFHHCLRHQDFQAVILGVYYEITDLYIGPGYNYLTDDIVHDGEIDGIVYHTKKPMIVLEAPIPVSQLFVALEHDFTEPFQGIDMRRTSIESVCNQKGL